MTTATLGTDYARSSWLAGLALSHSRGDGTYRGSSEGKVSSTVTGLYPYARAAVAERLSVWGALGYGTGTLTVTPKNEDGDGPDMKADLSLMMVAAGTRGELVSPGADGGPGLALESDAMFVRTESDASSGAGGNLAAAKADVSRLRLALVDGSWGIALAGGAALTPSLELGLRRDGGDAETGFGVDLARLPQLDPDFN